MGTESTGANAGFVLVYLDEGEVEGLSVVPGIPGPCSSSEGKGLNEGAEGMLVSEGDVIGV